MFVVLSSINSIAHNFNLQLPRGHSYFLPTTNFHLPFGLGQNWMMTSMTSFAVRTTPLRKIEKLPYLRRWYLALSSGSTKSLGVRVKTDYRTRWNSITTTHHYVDTLTIICAKTVNDTSYQWVWSVTQKRSANCSPRKSGHYWLSWPLNNQVQW